MMNANRLNLKDVITSAVALVALVLLVCATTPAAFAQSTNAARVNATIKPCFGMLLDVQLKSCGGVYKKSKKRISHSGSRRLYGLPRYIVYDCEAGGGSGLQGAANALADYGTLHIKSINKSCWASLTIEHPITIEGEHDWADTDNDKADITSADGLPCLRILPSAKEVVLIDLHLNAINSGDSSCIESTGANLIIESSLVRYDGNASAIKVSSGRFDMSHKSYIAAKTVQAAVSLNRVQANIEEAIIASTLHGMSANLEGDSYIGYVTLLQLADWYGFERGEGAVGADININTNGSILRLTGLDMAYFADGVRVAGNGEVLLSSSRIMQSTHGVVSDLSRLRVLDSDIYAQEVGIHVRQGEAFVGQTVIQDVHTSAILTSEGAKVQAKNNSVFPSKDGCAVLKWGNIPPEDRNCTAWYDRSTFVAPENRHDLSVLSRTEAPKDEPSSNTTFEPFGRKYVKAWASNNSYQFDNYHRLWEYINPPKAVETPMQQPIPYLKSKGS